MSKAKNLPTLVATDAQVRLARSLRFLLFQMMPEHAWGFRDNYEEKLPASWQEAIHEMVGDALACTLGNVYSEIETLGSMPDDPNEEYNDLEVALSILAVRSPQLMKERPRLKERKMRVIELLTGKEVKL